MLMIRLHLLFDSDNPDSFPLIITFFLPCTISISILAFNTILGVSTDLPCIPAEVEEEEEEEEEARGGGGESVWKAPVECVFFECKSLFSRIAASHRFKSLQG